MLYERSEIIRKLSVPNDPNLTVDRRPPRAADYEFTPEFEVFDRKAMQSAIPFEGRDENNDKQIMVSIHDQGERFRNDFIYPFSEAEIVCPC